MLQANCAKCHDDKAAAPGGGLVLFTGGSLIDVPADKRWKIWGMTHGGEMPPKGPPLSDGDVAALRAWAVQGSRSR